MIQEHILRSNMITEWTLYGGIDNFNEYKDLIKALKEAQEGDTIELRINCPGGRSDIGMMLVQAMRESKAIVICNVVYPTHSMGSIIAISGDFLIMQPHSFLMFHTYSCMTGGKSSDLIKDVHYMDRALKGMTNEVVIPFLTKAEVKRIDDGEDFYVTADCSSLPVRVKRHFKGISAVSK